jgi:small subunit ribosomal protein S6
MAFYENVFIARQDLAQPQVDALADQFTETLKTLGGEVKKREYWGLRSLTFRIKKNRKAHYVLLCIEAPAKAIAEMERTMGLNEDILRHLTVRVEDREGGGRYGDRDNFRPRRRDADAGEPAAVEGAI